MNYYGNLHRQNLNEHGESRAVFAMRGMSRGWIWKAEMVGAPAATDAIVLFTVSSLRQMQQICRSPKDPENRWTASKTGRPRCHVSTEIIRVASDTDCKCDVS